jgi:hypothetical protein
VRVIVQPAIRLRDAYQLEQFRSPITGLLPAHPHMQAERLHQLKAYCMHWIQGSHWVLEDHRDLASPDMLHFVFG